MHFFLWKFFVLFVFFLNMLDNQHNTFFLNYVFVFFSVQFSMFQECMKLVCIETKLPFYYFTLRSKTKNHYYKMWISTDAIEKICQKYVCALLSTKKNKCAHIFRFHIIVGFACFCHFQIKYMFQSKNVFILHWIAWIVDNYD